MNLHYQPQKQSFKLDCIYGGITMVLFILSFENAVRPLMQTYTLNSCMKT